jgi:predicted RNA-binding Zn-ribbon protein involved in translation (DUF1610 family)
VPRAAIRRLYESDAGGRLDEELLDEVFFGFLARCRSILTVTDAATGRVACPRCGAVTTRRVGQGEKDERLRCPGCGWSTTWGAYHRSYRDKQLVGGNAIGVFREFVRRAKGAGSVRERMILVDWIVHEAHKTVLAGQEEFHRPTAVNLIEGRMRDLIVFLNELAYGPDGTPGLAERADRWRAEIRPRLGRKPPPT